jgi:hypothetical protein
MHVNVPDLAQSIRFYNTLFDAPPTVVKDDYAKWMLEDPRLNFAISQHGRSIGLDHVGIQTETPAELGELARQLKAAGADTFDQQTTTCCYAKSDKTWVNDPAGLRWETFFTHGEATAYGEDEPPSGSVDAGPCCGMSDQSAPAVEPATACCVGAYV